MERREKKAASPSHGFAFETPEKILHRPSNLISSQNKEFETTATCKTYDDAKTPISNSCSELKTMISVFFYSDPEKHRRRSTVDTFGARDNLRARSHTLSFLFRDIRQQRW